MYNFVCGILLFPLKVILCYIIFLIIALVCFTNKFIFKNTFNIESLFIFLLDLLVITVGLNINIKNSYNLLHIRRNKGNLIIFNHINFLDCIVISYLEKQIPCGLISNKYSNMFPINIFVKLSDSIFVLKNNNTVDKIKNKLKLKTNVYMSPDACGIIESDKLIAPFKTGAFATKENIIPVIIRYVPSTSKNINWNNNTLLNLLFSIFIDGHIQCEVKVLNEEKYDNNSIEEYKDSVHQNMNLALSLLQPQYPPRIINGLGNQFIFYIFLLNLIFTSFSLYNLLFWVTNYFAINYPSNNSIIINQLFIFYYIYNV